MTILEHIIFCVMLVFIALVVDLFLTYTFPSFTLIAFIFLTGTTAIKAHRQYLLRKIDIEEIKKDLLK